MGEPRTRKEANQTRQADTRREPNPSRTHQRTATHMPPAPAVGTSRSLLGIAGAVFRYNKVSTSPGPPVPVGATGAGEVQALPLGLLAPTPLLEIRPRPTKVQAVLCDTDLMFVFNR